MKFSFSKGTLPIILEQLWGLYPTATRYVALEIKDSSSLSLFIYNCTTQEISQNSISIDTSDIIKQFDVRNNGFVWKNEQDLPFSLTPIQQHKNVDMFRELERNVLVIKIINTDWEGYILVYFSKNKKHFGFLESESSFTHENREIIGQTAVNAISFCLKKSNQDNQLLETIQKSINALSGNRKMEDRGNQSQVKLLENMILEMAVEYLQNIGKEQKISFILSPDAREKIQRFRGSPSNLRIMLNQACILAANLNSIDTVVIESWHLISNIAEQDESLEAPTPTIQHRHLKIYQWLDKIEDAVNSVIMSHENPTGALVGKAMQPSVSAPAISDMLNKQKQKIIILLNEFPTRWPQTRNHFKPVQNLLIKKNFDETKSA